MVTIRVVVRIFLLGLVLALVLGGLGLLGLGEGEVQLPGGVGQRVLGHPLAHVDVQLGLGGLGEGLAGAPEDVLGVDAVLAPVGPVELRSKKSVDWDSM